MGLQQWCGGKRKRRGEKWCWCETERRRRKVVEGVRGVSWQKRRRNRRKQKKKNRRRRRKKRMKRRESGSVWWRDWPEMRNLPKRMEENYGREIVMLVLRE